MGKQTFPGMASSRDAKSLLERAADAFDFVGTLRGANLPALDIPKVPIPDGPRAVEVQPSVADVDAGTAATVARAADWNGPPQPLDRAGLAEKGFLVPGTPVSGLAEEFRIIKRELLAHMTGSRGYEQAAKGNVILVTSAHPGDGKTWCSVNLALSLAAEGDLEVLLVDADFAKPGVPGALGLTTGLGFMDVLADPVLRVEDAVIRTDVPALSVLSSGMNSPRDVEHLASRRMEDVIAALVSGRPDRVVIFDSPPLLAASAASVLASHAGQTLLVVRADRTTETALRDAVGLLKGCAHVQLLLNGVKFSASGRRFGTYYGKEEAG